MNRFFNSFRENFMVLPAISLYYLITEHLISINKAEGESMLPTIRNNEILIVDKFWIRWFKLKKNDVIIAQAPVSPQMDICKRILYLPGEFVPEYQMKVPQNHVWIEGDNKKDSFDSRKHGPIPISLVKGRVLFNLLKFQKP